MTGYTHHLIEKDLDFNGFVWCCARAFGALVLMRDDSMDAPIPEEFTPSKFYVQQLRKAQSLLEHWGNLNDHERRAWAEQHRREELASWRERLAERVNETRKLKTMLEQVEKWTPPTNDHAGLKTFMIEQLTTSMDGTEFIEQEIARLESPGIINELVEQRYARLLGDIAYYTKARREEEERTASRNIWIKSLSESVGPPPGSPTAIRSGL